MKICSDFWKLCGIVRRRCMMVHLNSFDEYGFGVDVDDEYIPRKREVGESTRRARKEYLVDLLGGKCQKCGYDKSYAALDFHHIDRASKLFNIGQAIIEMDDFTFKRLVVDEVVKKCKLLCSNCHRELHWGTKEDE